MDRIILIDIKKIKTNDGTKVEYQYSIPDCMKAYMHENEKLYIESKSDLSDVPQAILAIPFVGVMSTVAIFMGVAIQVNELDERFFNCMKRTAETFKKMYPLAKLDITIEAMHKQRIKCTGQNSSVFYTGGVDATSALIGIIEKTPILVNVWGGDVGLWDNASHKDLEEYFDCLSDELCLKYSFVKSNARFLFKEEKLGLYLNRIIGHRNNHGWWASIAHILSMTSVISPWMWKNRITVHYIGSSYDASGKTFDSNNEELIQSLGFSDCRFEIVDNSLDRNEKVKKIIRFQERSGIKIQLKVCWFRKQGNNCSNCEKCYRTIMNIVANHGDPNNFGFYVDDETIERIHIFLKKNIVSKAFWKPIQDAFIAEKDFWMEDKKWKWMLFIKLNSLEAYFNRLCDKIFRR